MSASASTEAAGAARSCTCRVLSIDPLTKHGMAYSVLEGPERLIRWGTVDARNNPHDGTLSRVQRLIDELKPDYLVIEDVSAPESRRGERVQKLLRAIEELAAKEGVQLRKLAPRVVRGAFPGANNKEDVAVEIVHRFPELVHRLPPHRKVWMDEDNRINIFDATAQALALFTLRARKRGSKRRGH